MSRKLVSFGSPLEDEIGFSRAVRIGSHISVSGTAPIDENGQTACVDDLYGQTIVCLEILKRVIEDAGASLDDVIRTRIMLTNVADWQEAARAHGEYFHGIRPACTFVEVSRFIDESWLVEIEADAIVE